MTLIEKLFTSQDSYPATGPSSWDPLKEDDALEDVQFLDSRVCPTANRAALLFEMRTASHYPTGNAALLVVRGLQAFHWQGSPQSQNLMAFTVVSSRPARTPDNGLRLDLEFFPDGEFSVSGEHADFYLLEAPGITGAPPNYSGHHLDQVRNGLPWWDSPCTVLQSSTTSST
ncbi:hypothetical protein [Streptomyces sp. NBC_01465]|uniref:hypothetical protein n=1 Tax=Streptomyces sp. NBC_01465 TaxID=2903878 RepID=UPI002E34F882|nr:hypothetical protein [Streptomyces sp. NBC_01465]